MKIYLSILIVTFLFTSAVYSGEYISGGGESFAQEYAKLRELLEKVQNRESAVTYKPQIAAELDRLKSSQVNGGQAFDALSGREQQAFIQKFQNNHYHCGEVTQVMEERRRILLDPSLSEVLSSLIKNIP